MEQLPAAESYNERRKIFKDVWEKSKNEAEYNSDVVRKPKIIRTCRSSEATQRPVSGNKIRIKRLKTVCKKLLDYREFKADSNLHGTQKRRRKIKCKFSHTNGILKKLREQSPCEFINLELKTTWSPLILQDNIITDVKKIELLQDNRRNHKKLYRSPRGKPLVQVIKRNFNNIHKELLKMQIINI